jgi:beta-galactosidase
MGEPTPYYDARSSYCGIIDLAGFPKDRFYLYQSRWRPDLKVAHLLPHWNWPDKIGEKIPVHLFTSGDEAELFLNGKSLGRKKKNMYEYRLVWNDVEYNPGTLKAVVYKNGSYWTESTVKTTGKPAKIRLTTDQPSMSKDPNDLSFITAEILDADGNFIRNASNEIEFKVSSNGKILATDNGDPSDMVSFANTKRKAFSGLALAIVKKELGSGKIIISASSPGLQSASIDVIIK